MNNGRMPSRQVKLCFNQYDELIEKEIEENNGDEEHQLEEKKPKGEFTSEKIVNLGDPEYDVGKA